MPRPAPEDTVPAMLAPGEAVLNKEASDLVGRGVIAAANKAGLEVRRKGIVPTANCTGPVSVDVPVQGYSEGVSEVPDPNRNNYVNNSTGVTTLGGGANGQSNRKQVRQYRTTYVRHPRRIGWPS